ncbi:hypothetical protein EYF80_001913 [Liparis tanakae]|uniref:Uncharacterized protein n=1 Tax=Liparis tanakae TaxID=230148 RepID=A0A4Z2JCK4_9TELE|nr:hypothetical protein EYF80_001913 [Liparis tanakae]
MYFDLLSGMVKTHSALAYDDELGCLSSETCRVQVPVSPRPAAGVHSVCSVPICFSPYFPREDWIRSGYAP